MRYLVVLALSLIFSACTKPQRIVKETYKDGSPKLVHYVVDETPVKEERFYDSGTKEMEGDLNSSGQRDGLWTAWYKNGALWSEGEFKNDARHGYSKVYWPNGKLRYEGRYNEGKQIGSWTFYNEQGVVEKEVNFDSSNP